MVKDELYNDLQLSILDFVHVHPGSNPIQSLQNSTEMVQLADRLILFSQDIGIAYVSKRLGLINIQTTQN